MIRRSAAGPRCGWWQASRGAGSCRPRGVSSFHRTRDSVLQRPWRRGAALQKQRNQHLSWRPENFRAASLARKSASNTAPFLKLCTPHAWNAMRTSFLLKRFATGLQLPARWRARACLIVPSTRQADYVGQKHLPIGAEGSAVAAFLREVNPPLRSLARVRHVMRFQSGRHRRRGHYVPRRAARYRCLVLFGISQIAPDNPLVIRWFVLPQWNSISGAMFPLVRSLWCQVIRR